MDESQVPGPGQPADSNQTPAPTPQPPQQPTSSVPPVEAAATPSTPSSSQTPPPSGTPSAPPPPHVPPRLGSPPPPFSTPPPLSGAPISPAPKRGGRGWMLLSLILLVLLGLIVIGKVGSSKVRSYAHGSGGKSVRHKHELLEEVTMEDNSANHKILIIEVNGVISSADSDRREKNMVEDIADQLKTAADDSEIKAVILKVNSPGGEVLASDEIYNSIKDFQDTTGKPVIASMQTLAASGGYYISAPCRWIVANDLTITGSIGVIMHGFNYRGLMNKVGLRPMIFKSGKFKDMLSGDKDLDTEDAKEREEIQEEHQMVQELIMETYSKFTNVVQTGRSAAYAKNSKNKTSGDMGKELADNWTDFIDGRVLSGKKAFDLGFVDELGNFETAKERALTIAGIDKANYIEYQRPFDLGNLFRLFGSTETRPATVKVDLGIDAPKLQVGQMYFIAPTSVPK